MTPTRAEFVAEIMRRQARKRKADRQEYCQYRKEILSRTIQQRKTLRRTSL